METYVELLLQKYRLAVVLAVLRNKPSNISVEDYIIDLRSKIQEPETEFSLNEDDFNMSDDEVNFNTLLDVCDDKSIPSVSLLRDFDDDLCKKNEIQHLTKDMGDEVMEIQQPTQIIETNDSDITYMEVENSRSIDNKKNNLNLEHPSNDKVLKMRMDNNLTRVQIDENATQSLIYESQATNYNSCINQSCTHISQSQDVLYLKTNDSKIKPYQTEIVSNKILQIVDPESQSIQINVHKKIKPIMYTESLAADINSIITQYSTPNLEAETSNTDFKSQPNTFNVDKTLEKIDYIDLTTQTKVITDVCNNSKEEFIGISDMSKNIQYVKKNNIKITQETEICEEPKQIEIPNATQSNINYSVNNIPISEINNPSQDLDFSQDILSEEMFTNEPALTQDSLLMDVDDDELQYLFRNKCDSLLGYNINSEPQKMDIDFENRQKKDDICNVKEFKINEPLQVRTNEILFTSQQEINEILNETDELNELTESQAEIIPFKVIGELKIVKAYLSKIEYFSDTRESDSGFKSNRSSLNYSASQSTHRLNQSAHSLFIHLSQAPLVSASMEINSEIAKVLGELIDKLHENEKYPTFLEDMLGFVASSINIIYEGSNVNNTFLKTDETIERLLLFNRSNNITKFTIEKIMKILESFYEHIEKDEIIEMIDINKTENIAYIFHLLETLLKKYTKLSQNFSQCTKLSQMQSQIDKSLKHSTLTEIWRKQWNLTKADIAPKEETDILVQCSDILNKIIVKAMERYSLVAYAALQCFNLLQS